MATVIRESTTKLGKAKGNARLWLEGRYLQKAGFLPGVFLALSVQGQALEIRHTDAPTDNRVSSKKDGAVSVIDLNNKRLAEMFGEGGDLHVRVEADRIIIRRGIMATRIAARPRDGSVGSIFSGAGLLDAAAREAGFTPRFGVEWNPKYAELFQQNAPEATVYNCSVHEALMLDLPSCELLVAGIPCEPWSTKRRLDRGTGAKRDMSLVATAHELGDMTLFALAIIAKVNPRTVVIEEAPAYVASETGVALLGALRRLGYVVEARTMSPHDYGFIARRNRTVIVAQTPEADGTVPSAWPTPQATATTLGDLLDADVPESTWFNRQTKGWLYAHAERHAERGNGFTSAVVIEPTQSVIPTVSKRYFAQQGDGVRLAHPARPDTHRWLSLSEVRRIMGVPETMDLGESVTTAGEVVGQGVHIGLFTAILSRATGRVATASVQVTPLPVETAAPTREQGDLFAA